MPLITRMMLDSVILLTLSKGDIHELQLGDIDGYGDALVQQKVRSRLNDPSQFESLMTELSLAAHHRFDGHKVTPYETLSWPDLRVDVPCLDVPILYECKRLLSVTQSRLLKTVTEANRQIKSVGIEAYGVAFLDVGAHVPPASSMSDEVPAEILRIVEDVTIALRGPKNRSVGQVILAWDDAGLVGEPPERTAVCLRRRFLKVDHSAVEGVREVHAKVPVFHGSTVLFAVDWEARAQG